MPSASEALLGTPPSATEALGGPPSASAALTQDKPPAEQTVISGILKRLSDAASAFGSTVARTAQEVNSALLNAPGAIQDVVHGVMGSDPDMAVRGVVGGVNAAGAPIHAVAGPTMAAPVAGLSTLAGMDPVNAAKAGQHAETIGSFAVPFGLEAAGMARGIAEPGREMVQEGGRTIAKNPPADPALQEKYVQALQEKGVDVTQPQAVADHVAAQEGVPAPEVRVDPEAQISKTEGQQITVEPGTPGEVATRVEHEVQHAAEDSGKLPPPEDNNAIVASAIEREQPQRVQIPDEIRQDFLADGVHKDIVDTAGELFVSGKLQRDPNKLISDQVMEGVIDGTIPTPQLAEILKKNNKSLEEFGRGMLRISAGDAGRALGFYSRIQRNLNKLDPTNAARVEELTRLGRVIDESSGWWDLAKLRARGVINIWRGLLTSQWVTAARNAISQGTRFGIKALDMTTEAFIQKASGREIAPENRIDPLDGLDLLVSLMKDQRGIVKDLISQRGEVADKVFTTYSSDVHTRYVDAAGNEQLFMKPADRAIAAANKAVNVINFGNRLQEFMYRRTGLITRAGQRARNFGYDLGDVIKDNKWSEIPQDVQAKILEPSMTDALELTFAQSPAAIWGRSSPITKMVSAIQDMPPALAAVPFPRFLLNAAKFTFNHSPAGLLKLLSKTEQAHIAAGDFHTYSEALSGTLMMAAAYEFRKSEHAGEKWNEVKIGSRTIDMRPFAGTLAPYLFIGDVFKRHEEGTLNALTSADLADAVLSSNVRAGTGLYVADQTANLFSNSGDGTKLGEKLKRLGGEFIGGFLTPVQMVRDFLAEYDTHLQTQKDVAQSPFLGPSMQKIPGLNQTLPDKYTPTQADPRKYDLPVIRQATGLTINEPKNVVQQELDRLGVQPFQILKRTGDPEFDNLMAQKMGKMVEENLSVFVQSAAYQRLDNIQRYNALKMAMAQVAKAAREQALAQKAKAQSMPWYQKKLIEEHPPDTLDQMVQ